MCGCGGGVELECGCGGSVELECVDVVGMCMCGAQMCVGVGGSCGSVYRWRCGRGLYFVGRMD